MVLIQKQQKDTIGANISGLQSHLDWYSITAEAQQNAIAQIEGCAIEVPPNVEGLKKHLANDVNVNGTRNSIIKHIEDQASQARVKAAETERQKQKKSGKSKNTLEREIQTDTIITSKEDFDELIKSYNDLNYFCNSIDLKKTICEEFYKHGKYYLD